MATHDPPEQLLGSSSIPPKLFLRELSTGSLKTGRILMKIQMNFRAGVVPVNIETEIVPVKI